MAVERDPLIWHGIKVPFQISRASCNPLPRQPIIRTPIPPKISGIFRKINEKEIVGDRYHGDFESREDERSSLGRKISKENFGFFHGKVTETESGGEGQLFLKWERESCCFVYYQIEKVSSF
ncbi:hypothetical protein ACE6H2_003041 [Prunus campanulata]